MFLQQELHEPHQPQNITKGNWKLPNRDRDLQVCDWVYIKKKNHKLDGCLCKITSMDIDSKHCWITYYGKSQGVFSQNAYFEKKQFKHLKLCTDKKAIAEVIERDWGKPSKDNHNRNLSVDTSKFVREEEERKEARLGLIQMKEQGLLH